MRQEFLDIVNKLKSDEYCAISVIDDSTMNKILTTSSGSLLVQKYGSVENYFENLKNSGVNSISIQEYRKNGSGWKNTGNIIRNLTFHDKNTAVNSVPSHTPAPVYPLNGGLNGQVVGLGFVEAANLIADSKENVRLVEENKYLKEKNERLEKDIFDLKEEKLKREYDASSKSEQNGMITKALETLPALLQGFASMKTSSGLNAPAQQSTPIKNEFIALITNPDVSDQFVQVLQEVATKISTEQGFYDKLEKILTEQQQ